MPFLIITPGQGVPVPPPGNVALPTLTGSVQDGQTLTASQGTWTNNPTSYAYAYYFDGVHDTTQTGTSVNLTGKAGKYLYLIVTATNAGGSTTAQSITYGPIQAASSFSFTPVYNAALNTLYTSNTVTMTQSGAISISGAAGAQYKKNNDPYTSNPGTAVPGDTITLQVTSSGSNQTATNVSFTIASFTAQWSVTTLAATGHTTQAVTLGDVFNHAVISNNGLTLSPNTATTWTNSASAFSSYKLSPMTYFEVTVQSLPCYIGVGAAVCSLQDYAGNDNQSIGITVKAAGQAANGNVYQNGGQAMTFQNTHPPGVGTVIGIAWDDQNRVYFSVNGNWSGDSGYVFNPAAKTGGLSLITTRPASCEIMAYVGIGGVTAGTPNAGQLTCNFGASAFAYPIPTGYQSVNDSPSGNWQNPASRIPVAPTQPTNYPNDLWTAYAPATYPGLTGTVDYYIDASYAGASDNNDGKSPTTPWKTLASVCNRTFLPGTVIAFKCGTGPYQGDPANVDTTRMQLNCNGSATYPIIFTSYGAGAKPIIKAINADYEASIAIGNYQDSGNNLSIGRRTASHIVIDGLALTGGRIGSGSTIGNEAAVAMNHGSHDIEIYNCEMYTVGGGPYCKGAYNVTAYYNYIHNLTEVLDDGSQGSYGSEGITVGGPQNAPCHNCYFRYNSFDTCLSNSVAFGYDGGILELFGFIDTVYLEYNFCNYSQGSTEGGGQPGNVSNIFVNYNIFKDCATLTVYHNSGGTFGGNFTNVQYNHNTFYETRANPPDIHLGPWYSDGVYSSSQLTATYNIIYMSPACNGFWANGANSPTPGDVHTNNVYCRGATPAASIPFFSGQASTPNAGLSTGESLIVDPGFIDPANNNFSLASGSTASGFGALPTPIGINPPITQALPATFVAAEPVYPTAPAPTVFYDPQGGNDANDGLTAATPKQTMAACVTLAQSRGPGQCIGVKRGSVTSSQSGCFIENWTSGTQANPNWIVPYGTGAAPIFRTDLGGYGGDGSALYCAMTIRLSSCWINVDGLAPNGFLFCEARDGGLRIYGQNGEHYWSAGDGINVYNCEFYRCGIGIELDASGSHYHVEKNYIHDGVMVWNNNASSDYGANGVRVANGNDKYVRFNRFHNLVQPDPEYGSDGGAVEFFADSINGCEVSYNYATNTNGFTEGGGYGATHNNITVHHNLMVNTETFSTFHNSGGFGATWTNCSYFNNTFVQFAPLDVVTGAANSYIYQVCASSETTTTWTFYNNVYYMDQTVSGATAQTILSVYDTNMGHTTIGTWAHDNFYYVAAAGAYQIPNTAPLGEGGGNLTGVHMFNQYTEELGTNDQRILPTTTLFVNLSGGDYRIAATAAAYGKGAL